MFAGPNGSGKSTLKEVIRSEMLGIYVNPDEIERDIRQNGFLDLSLYGIDSGTLEMAPFFQQSSLLKAANLLEEAILIGYSSHNVDFTKVQVNSYYASVIADFLRQKLLQSNHSFTFETVMSSPDKVAFLQKAQQCGFRTYLYFVATEDPQINISRVHNRVSKGGHSVPIDKIVSRYYRSLELLLDAVRYSDRAYIFDNSEKELCWIAEITSGEILELKTDQLPQWFQNALWDKTDLN
jgi:predicted ABC-type ATPase